MRKEAEAEAEVAVAVAITMGYNRIFVIPSTIGSRWKMKSKMNMKIIIEEDA